MGLAKKFFKRNPHLDNRWQSVDRISSKPTRDTYSASSKEIAAIWEKKWNALDAAEVKEKQKLRLFSERTSPVIFHNFWCEKDTHLEDVIDDNSIGAPEFLKKWLEYNRMRATDKFKVERPPNPYAFHDGKRVVLTMASRFGDVGIRETEFEDDNDYGYSRRVMLSDLKDFHESSKQNQPEQQNIEAESDQAF